MGTHGWKVLTLAVALLLAAGIPFLATTAVHADPDCGHKCESPCGEKCGCGHDAGKCGCGHGKHMHGDHASGGPGMKAGMGKHLAEVREKIAKLRDVEGKMAGQLKDAEAFRAASLEHAKLLTDIQESHVRHMEGMMGK